MTEVTRVPLPSIAKGSMAKFWIAVLLAALVAGAVAWWTSPPRVWVETIEAGHGPHPTLDDIVFIDYTGKLAKDGTVFDQSHEPPWPIPGIMPKGFPMPVKDNIPGFTKALLQMRKGGKYKVEIPASMAYGAYPPANSQIPPNANLVFDVTMNDFMPREKAEERLQQLQEAAQKQQAAAKSAASAGKPATHAN